METPRKFVCLFFLCVMLMVVRSRSDQETQKVTSLTSTNGGSENGTHVDVGKEIKKSNKGGFGGEFGWGWGGGGGGGVGGGSGNGTGKGGPNGGGGGGGGVSKKGGWGGGWGGGGGGSYKWGCHNIRKKQHNVQKRDFSSMHYKIGEFAQCMVEGRCKGMRLDCPLHCGGPCYYDCRYMCKSHCRRKH